MLKRIDRILLRVPALASAVRYYCDVLGMKLLRQDKQIATLSFGDGMSEMVLHTDPDLPAEAIYYLVDDVQNLYQRRSELKLTFTNAPTRISRGYRAGIRDPFGNHLLILDRSLDRSGEAAETTQAAGGALFAGVETRLKPHREALVRIYEKVGRTADDLPYTPQFESLHNAYLQLHPDPKPTLAETWRHLLNLRKAGKLPKLGEARSTPPPLSPEQKLRLVEMLGEDIGRRDRLPYTDRFNELVDEFNRSLPRSLSPHLLWRAVATLGKAAGEKPLPDVNRTDSFDSGQRRLF